MSGTDPAQPRVLLIDDDDAITTVLGSFLARSGFAVRTAADGASGLALFRTAGADVVVLDVSMPVLDGREVLRRSSWSPACGGCCAARTAGGRCRRSAVR